MLTSALNRTVAIAAFMALALPASAQTLVIGPGPEKDCYDGAQARRATSGAFEACKMALENVSLANRDRAATFVNRSVLYLTRNQPVAALSDTGAALSLQPELAGAFINRSSALYMLKRYAEAKAAVDTALPLAHGDDVQLALFNRAMASEALGDTAAAYKDLKAALARDPNFAPAQTELARFEVVR